MSDTGPMPVIVFPCAAGELASALGALGVRARILPDGILIGTGDAEELLALLRLASACSAARDLAARPQLVPVQRGRRPRHAARYRQSPLLRRIKAFLPLPLLLRAVAHPSRALLAKVLAASGTLSLAAAGVVAAHVVTSHPGAVPRTPPAAAAPAPGSARPLLLPPAVPSRQPVPDAARSRAVPGAAPSPSPSAAPGTLELVTVSPRIAAGSETVQLLIAASGGPVSWSVSASLHGVTFSPASGVLAAGGEADVTVTLPAPAAVPFSVMFSWDGQSVSVQVTVAQAAVQAPGAGTAGSGTPGAGPGDGVDPGGPDQPGP